METDVYLSLKERSEGLFKSKGSKHFSYGVPIRSEKDVKDFIEELKIEHSSAGHFCYAYRLGHDGAKYRSNDDGEPYNSAGPPILGVLKSRELTNTLIVVVRYFGGTKLGISGLIEAYREADIDAIQNGDILENFRSNIIKISYTYIKMGDVMNILKKSNIKPYNTDFQNNCSLEINVKHKDSDSILNQLAELSEVQIEILHEG